MKERHYVETRSPDLRHWSTSQVCRTAAMADLVARYCAVVEWIDHEWRIRYRGRVIAR